MVVQEKYSELEAQKVVKTLTEAVAYCQSMCVVHRDLKVSGTDVHVRRTFTNGSLPALFFIAITCATFALLLACL